MSNTEFFKLQDLILKKTSLEKVRIHLESRKERSVYSWIMSELKEFMRSRDEDLRPYINQIVEGVKSEDYKKVLEGVNASIKYWTKKSTKYTKGSRTHT